MWTNAISFWDDLLDPLMCTFDGENRRIYLNPQYDIIRVKEDLYSASKRWLQRRQNFSFLPPLRTIGGDTIGAGLHAGDIYFLINDWQVVVSHNVKITGVLYSDNTSLVPFIITPGGGVESTVSAIAFAYETGNSTGPTAQEIRDSVWTANAGTYTTPGTTGNILDNLGDPWAADLSSYGPSTAGNILSNTLSGVSDANIKLDTLPVGVSAQIVVDLQDEITNINTIPDLRDDIASLPAAIRTELAPDLAHLATLQNGLTTNQAIMLLEIYTMYGLDPTKPLVVDLNTPSNGTRTFGDIDQSIQVVGNKTTVTRLP
jgi:hypothetical protein